MKLKGRWVKEEKSILNLYLSKFAAGDTACIPKLIRRLADRVLFIPILNRNPNGEKPGVSIKVYRHKNDEHEVVPVFTSEQRFEVWREKQSTSLDKISVLGADLCIALGGKNWISIDEGTSHSAVFTPDLTMKIAETPAPEAESSDTQPIYLAPQQIISAASETEEQKVTETVHQDTTSTVTSTHSKLQDWD